MNSNTINLNINRYLNLRKKDERVKVIVVKNQFLKLSEFLELFQVSMVHNQVKPHIL